MAQCSKCGKQTIVFESGVPICTECIDKREGKKPVRPDRKAERRPDEKNGKKSA